MLLFFRYVIITLLLWFFIHTVFIVVDGLWDERNKSDVAIIFGNTVNPDGTLSERLKKRFDKGIELFRDSTVETIVVSGGLGKEGFYEGTKMYEYLIEEGIPKQKILIDNLGVTTKATAENFKRLGFDSKSVVVVTQYFHISRAKLALKKAGYKNVSGAHADYFEIRDVYSMVREFPAYYKYLLS